jgi:hypothetical protein
MSRNPEVAAVKADEIINRQVAYMEAVPGIKISVGDRDAMRKIVASVMVGRVRAKKPQATKVGS